MTVWKTQVSPWQDSVSLKTWPKLEGVDSADVLVIGGGMAGVLTAWKLASSGIDVILAEAFRVGQGITAGTTGKITSQHGLIYQKLVHSLGTEGAALYLEANEKAIREFAQLAQTRECDFQRRSNLVYSLNGKKKIEAEMKALEKLGYAAKFREETELPFPVDGAVEFPEQAQFNPLKLMKALTEEAGADSKDGTANGITNGTANGTANGTVNGTAGRLRIYEGTRIINLKKWHDGGWEASSDNGMIMTDQVVIASHFPFYNGRGAYFLKMYQSQSCAVAGTYGKKAEPLTGMYVDEDEKGFSLRDYGNLRILIGGGGRPGNVGTDWKSMEMQAETFYPAWKTRYRWAAQDCMSLDQIPYIGPYYGGDNRAVGHERGLWVASGFNKWGMTGSMVSAMVLAAQIVGKTSPYAEIFRPSRSILKPQLLVNGGEAVLNLLRPSSPRCKHMGCALKWNEIQQAWECPCHGSRYDEEGTCIEGPSKKNLF